MKNEMDNGDVLEAIRVLSKYCKESECHNCMLIECCIESNPSRWVDLLEGEEENETQNK